MHYLGIDIGKDFHVVGCITESGGPVTPFKFKSNLEGYKMFKERLGPYLTNPERVKIGIEATGHYWLNIYEKLTRDGYSPALLNPIQVHAFRNQGIRGTKTDSTDSLLIAKMLRLGEYIDTKLKEDATASLRHLTRYRHELVEQIASIKNRVICLLDTVFPEYEKLFSDVFGPTSLALLRKASTPEEILELDNKKLLRLFMTTSRGKFGQEAVARIKDVARNSFGSKIASAILSKGAFEYRIFDTICNNVLRRQAEAKKLASAADVVLVIGGKMSANTRHLAKICSDRGAKTYHIDSVKEFKHSWFKGAGSVAVISGASTPDETVDRVILKLKKII